MNVKSSSWLFPACQTVRKKFLSLTNSSNPIVNNGFRFTCTQTHFLVPKLHQNQQSRHSTRIAKGSLKAYHKRGMNAFVYSLTESEREELLATLKKASQANQLPTDQQQKAANIPSPTSDQLRYVTIFSGIPFVGFGILDNTIMLTAGEYIDITFGAWLGITTMAAAALGNMVSDVLGITTAGFVEQSALKLGLKAPDITLEQMSLRRTRISANLGRCIGVCIGCLFGMWPLWVFSKSDSDEEDDKSPK